MIAIQPATNNNDNDNNNDNNNDNDNNNYNNNDNYNNNNDVNDNNNNTIEKTSIIAIKRSGGVCSESRQPDFKPKPKEDQNSQEGRSLGTDTYLPSWVQFHQRLHRA